MKFTRHPDLGLVAVALAGSATARTTGSATSDSPFLPSAQPQPHSSGSLSQQPQRTRVCPAGTVASRYLGILGKRQP